MTPDGKMPTDKRVIRRYFARSLETYCSAAAVQKKMAGQLALGWGRKRYPLIVELGAGAGFLSDEIVRHLDYDRLIVLDLVPECAAFHAARPRAEFAAADMEDWEFPAGVDLVTGNAVMQWAAEPLRLFRRIRAALAPGGELVFSTFGPGNLGSLTRFQARPMNYFSAAELGALLRRAELTVRHVEISEEKVEFASPVELLRHLHDTGVGAPGATGRFWTKKDLAELAAACRNAAGKFELHYQPIYIAAEKPL